MLYQPMRWFTDYTALNAPHGHIYAVSDKNLFMALGPFKVLKEKRDPKKFYRFHKEMGHYIANCYDLKEKIKNLF